VRLQLIAGTVVLIAILVLLWVFPSVLFPHPSTNEAIELSALELPVLLAGLLGLVAAIVVFRGRQSTVLRVGLGVFLLGVAADFVLGLSAFGNLSDDRFMPLLFLPVPIGLAGLLTLITGFIGMGRARRDILLGAGIGFAAAAFVAVWTLVRSSRDWLQAPYGFDIAVLIVVVGVVVAFVGLIASRAPATGGGS